MLQYFNNLHDCFSVEITQIDDSFTVSFICSNYRQLFTLESLFTGDVIFRPELRSLLKDRWIKTELTPIDAHDFNIFAVRDIRPNIRLLEWIMSIPKFSSIFPNLNYWFFDQSSSGFVLKIAKSYDPSLSQCKFFISRPNGFRPFDSADILTKLVRVVFIDFFTQISSEKNIVNVEEHNPFKSFAWTPINRLNLDYCSAVNLACCFATRIDDFSQWKSEFSHGYLYGVVSDLTGFCESLSNCLKGTESADVISESSRLIELVSKQKRPIDDIIDKSDDWTFLQSLYKL
ncbi:hypothetical protein GEMRC1_005331 [Eukaryota sp. GEM-RC1]